MVTIIALSFVKKKVYSKTDPVTKLLAFSENDPPRSRICLIDFNLDAVIHVAPRKMRKSFDGTEVSN